MKKLLLAGSILFSGLILASCGGTEIDYTLDKSVYSKSMAQSWLGSSYEDVATKYDLDSYLYPTEDYEQDENTSRFELHLPKDESMARYAQTDATDYILNDVERLDKLSLNMWLYDTRIVTNAIAFLIPYDFNFDSKVKPLFTNVEVNNYSDEFSSNGLRYNIPSEEIEEAKKNHQDGEKIYLNVLYMPIFVELYIPKQDSDAVKILETFVTMPVAYEIVVGEKETPITQNYDQTEIKLTDGYLLN